MKKILSLFTLLIFNSFFLIAQDYSKLNYTLVKKIIETNELNRPAALFVQGDVNFIKWKTAELGGRFKYSAGDVAAIVLPISKVTELASDSKIIRMEDNYMKLGLMNDSMVVKNRIVDANIGTAPLTQGYDGTGVVMGIIDTGIDFAHPDFKDSTGNTTIKFIWDHELPNGPNTPQPYNYGQEFTSADINSGQAALHIDDYAPNPGHGTHVSGVAAGNGLALNHFAGVAPKSDIIFVAANFNLPSDDDWLNSVVDAVEYIYTKADSMGEPCVINISAGVVLGSHDAKDLQAVMIDNLISAQDGRALVCAAGNYGNLPLHLRHSIALPDTAFTWFAYNGNIYTSLPIEMWATPANFDSMQFTIAVDKVSPYFEYRAMIPYSLISQHVGIFITDTLKNNNGQRIALVESFGSLAGGRYSMKFNIIPDSITGYYYRLMTTGTGTFDYWNYWAPYNNVVSTGLPTAAVFPDITKYVLPDYTQNVVSSFTCSDKVLAVANYINKSSYQACDNTNLIGTDIPGALAANSSIGPTRDGRIKPDIAATGTLTFAPVRTGFIGTTAPVAMALGCLHLRDGGTSNASPVVAGVAALYFQHFPNADWFDVKQAVTLCAYKDSFVNAAGTIPNNIWGYGKVDGFQTIIPCAAIGIHETEALINDNFYVSPNPFNDQAIVHFDFSGTKSKKSEVKIFDAIGNEVRRISISKIAGEIVLKKQDLRSGIYFISLVSEGQYIATRKLVIL